MTLELLQILLVFIAGWICRSLYEMIVSLHWYKSQNRDKLAKLQKSLKKVQGR